MTANENPLNELEALFEAFEATASDFHPSYASALKNVRTFVVLDTSAGPLFVSEKYFRALGKAASIEKVPSDSNQYKSYLSGLERLAKSQRVSFSQRNDPNWRPHIFFRVVDFSQSKAVNKSPITKLQTNESSHNRTSKAPDSLKEANASSLYPKNRNGNDSIPASAQATSLIVTSAVVISAVVIFLGNLGGARDFVCSIKALKNGCQQIFDLPAE